MSQVPSQCGSSLALETAVHMFRHLGAYKVASYVSSQWTILNHPIEDQQRVTLDARSGSGEFRDCDPFTMTVGRFLVPMVRAKAPDGRIYCKNGMVS